MIETTIEFITPELAKQYLALNTTNRRIRQTHVDSMSRDITNHNFKMTGDAIKFNSRGEMIDGQHRLSAIIQAGQGVWMLVVRGLDDDIFPYLDDKRLLRSAADVLDLCNMKNSTIVAAVIRLVAQYDSGGRFRSKELERRLNNDGILAIAKDDPTYVEAAAFGKSNAIARVIHPSLIGAWYYCTRRLVPEKACEFWTAVGQGGNREELPQAWVLRERLMQAALSPKKLVTEHRFAYGVRAWNAWRRGAKVSHLTHQQGTVVPRFK